MIRIQIALVNFLSRFPIWNGHTLSIQKLTGDSYLILWKDNRYVVFYWDKKWHSLPKTRVEQDKKLHVSSKTFIGYFMKHLSKF